MKWIKCSERMPEEDRNVLICLEGSVLCAYWSEETIKNERFIEIGAKRVWYEAGDGEQYCAINDDYVTHWMSLPQSPKENE